MFYNAKLKTLSIDNTTMDYVTFGRGEIPFVIIPGLSLRGIKGSTLPLAFMYRIFAKEYTVYIFDRKKDIPAGYTVRDIARDVAEGMKLLSISDAAVMGISQGGMVAQYLALEHPKLVNKLVLGVTLSRNNDTVEKVIADWIGYAENNDYESIVKDLTVKMYSEAYVKKYKWLFPILLKVQKLSEPERFVILAKACLTCNTYNDLREIKCPVLVLGGKKDMIVTGEASEEMAEKLGCEIYMYEDLGHSAYEEAEDFNKRVYDFLDK